MEIEFAIAAWTAFAPGLLSHAQWKQWATDPFLPQGDGPTPEVRMPSLLRRRLAPLGRLAAEAAYECQLTGGGIPMIFASRYGDAARSLKLLRDYAEGGDMSPTDFALSVHNAIGGLYSIARRDGSNYSCIAGGRASAAVGLVEAVALMQDGAEEVLLVCYDTPLPDAYAPFADEPQATYAWAWRITPPAPGAEIIRLSTASHAPHPNVMDGAALPFGLACMQFMLLDAGTMTYADGGTLWTWRRDV